MIELKVVFDITPSLSSAISMVANVFNKKEVVPEELAKGLKGLAEREHASQAPEQLDAAQSEPKKRKTKKADAADQESPTESEKPAENEQNSNAVEPEKAVEQESKPAPEIEEKPTEATPSDPMQGMTVMQAAQKLLNEVKDADLDMVEVNKRVRAKASELGLSYGSVACLIKAVGYSEARVIALGE